jgi:NAD-dependent dihydropyrimidine dehydrogenase PreA subunit
MPFGRLHGMYMVVVDSGKCEGCEDCINVCPIEVFRMEGEKSDPFRSAECVYCESCLCVCPAEAIVISEI